MNRKRRRELKAFGGPEPQVRRVFQKINRNDLCPCGSGLKFKKCSCFDHSKQYFELKKAEDERSNRDAEEAGD